MLEKLVNHSPSARDLQAFLVFSQHPAWVITPVTRRKCGLLLNYFLFRTALVFRRKVCPNIILRVVFLAFQTKHTRVCFLENWNAKYDNLI